MDHVVDILPLMHVPAWLSFLGAYVVGVAGYLAIVVLLLRAGRRNRRRALSVDAAVDPDRPLVEGEAVLVGVVEVPDDGPAVRVVIEQEGTEKLDSGQWTHLWAEKNRRMHVRPFFLRLGSGERVLVEPTREAILFDDLDGIVHEGDTRRLRTAELTPGEQVIVTGVLTRKQLVGYGAGSGYRDGATGWVLAPPRREPMLLSTEPLGLRFMQRARASFAGVIAAVFVLTGVHVSLVGYHLRLWRGQTVVGVVVEQRHYTTVDDDDETDHYVVAAEVGGQLVRDDVYSFGYYDAHEDARIAARVVPGHSWASTLGSGATTTFWHLILVVVGLFMVLFFVGVTTPRRWQEGKVNDSGGGRLPRRGE